MGLRERVERVKLMPIRRGVGEVLRSYSEYTSSPRQRKREGKEEAYEESYDNTSSLPDDIRQKKAHRACASIEM